MCAKCIFNLRFFVGSGYSTGSVLLVKNVKKPDIRYSVFYYSAIMIFS